jgi:hypothetical protein
MARTRAKWRHTPPIESTKRASKTGRDGDEDDYSDSVSIPGSIDDEQPSNEGHEHHTANKGHSDVDDGLDLDLIKNLRVINKVGHKTVKVYDPPCDYCSERSRDCLWDALSKKCAPCVRAHIACKRSGVSVVELLKKAQAVHFSVTSESLTAQSLSMKTNNAKSIASTDSPPPERRSKRPSRPTNGDEYLYFHPASKGKSVVAGRQNSASAPQPRSKDGRFGSISASTSKAPKISVASQSTKERNEPRDEEVDSDFSPPLPPAPERKKREAANVGSVQEQPQSKKHKREEKEAKIQGDDSPTRGPSSHHKAEKLEALFSAYSSVDETINAMDTLAFALDPDEDNVDGRDIGKMRVNLAEMKKQLIAMKQKVAREPYGQLSAEDL